MSATEIIEQLKALPSEERLKVLNYFAAGGSDGRDLYDDFTVLGLDAEGSDVSHALQAQADVILDERS